MAQMELNFGPRYGRRYEAFKKFHRENPKVYELFVQYSLQALRAGRERFSARMIFERIRWYTAIETSDPDFKLCNNHFPYYARLLMLKDERFQGFFSRRDATFDVDDETIKKELC